MQLKKGFENFVENSKVSQSKSITVSDWGTKLIFVTYIYVQNEKRTLKKSIQKIKMYLNVCYKIQFCTSIAYTLWIIWVENLQHIQAKSWKLLVKCWKWGKSWKITASTENVEKIQLLAQSISLLS